MVMMDSASVDSVTLWVRFNKYRYYISTWKYSASVFGYLSQFVFGFWWFFTFYSVFKYYIAMNTYSVEVQT